MKINFPHLAALIFTFLLGVFGLLWLSSCSPQFHHDKAEKKGYVYSCDTTTVTIHDTIKGKDGKDSLIYVPVKAPCPTIEAPKTNTEIRNERKSEKDSLKHIERMYKLRYNFIIDSLQKENKRLKIEGNTNVKIEKQDTKQIKAKVEEVIKVTKSNNKSGFFDRLKLVGLGILIGSIAMFILFVLYLAKRK